jgi:hypothetical protein
MNPRSYAHLIFNKGTKNIQGIKNTSSAEVAGKTRYLHAENSNYIHVFHPMHVSTQSELRNLLLASAGKSREHTGINSHRQ